MADRPRLALGPRLFAFLMARVSPLYEPAVARRKRRLFADLRGTVLEIGSGTGPNLALLPDAVERVLAVEPNPNMYPHLRAAAERTGRAVEILPGRAERLPVDDASVDAVVSTLVLCSVDDLAATLAEVRRVLVPGGRFVFVEHVAAPRGTWRRRLQRLVRPAWRRLADNCHPDRETDAAIRAAGFSSVDLEPLEVPFGGLLPHVAGVARATGTPSEAEGSSTKGSCSHAPVG